MLIHASNYFGDAVPDTNGKILQMISMINSNQTRMDEKLDRLLDRTSHLEASVAALPCRYMEDRINKIEDDTKENTSFRWSLKGQISLIGLVSAIVSAIITYFRR